MHKYITILFLFITSICFAQSGQFVIRSSGVVTNIDVRAGATLNWYMPYNISDTSLNGGVDTLGALLNVRSGSLQGVWYRDSVSTGGHQWLQIARTNQNYWTLNSTSLYPNSTSYNVGIGTTSPSYKFHVVNGNGNLGFDASGRLILYNNISNHNIAIGESATGISSSKQYNISIGYGANQFSNGDANIAIGATALLSAGNGNNTAVGLAALYATDSTDNSGFGYNAGIGNYGTRNVSIGSTSGNFAIVLQTAALSNSDVVTSTSTLSGADVATFITNAGLSIGVRYVFNTLFAGTPPAPYTVTGGFTSQGTVTNSNTISFPTQAVFTTQGSGGYTLTVYNKQDNSIAIGYNARTTVSNQIVLGNSSNTSLKANQVVLDLSTVPTTGYVLTWDGSKYSPAAGGASSLTFTLPLLNTAGVVSINSATTSTSGVVTPNASDFNLSGAALTIDYVNGQAASTSLKGFLSATDWNTFNGKASAATGAITTFYSSNATASRAIVSDVSGKLSVSATTSTEIGYVNGVTSAIQTQLNAKLGTSLTSGQILVGNGSNVAAGVAMSGAATITNAGVLSLSSTGVVAGTYGSANITVGADGRITAAADGTGGGGAGTVTTVLGSSPIVSDGDLVTPTISILNAKADGSTKGAAWFSSNDFNDNGSGGISLDYTNGQAASAGAKGYLIAADWTTFNNKVSTTRTITAGTGLTGGGDLSADRTITLNTIAGFIASGTNIGITGTGSISSPYTISANATGLITAGTNVTITGSGTTGSPYVINSSGGGGGGITSLNGLTGATQIFAIGSTGTSPNWISSGTIHSLNIPTTNASNTGLVTPTLFNTWNAKQDAITGAATTIVSSNLTSSRAVISNALGKIDVSTATSTDLTNLVAQYTGQTLTDGATITMNCNSGYNGTVTIAGNRTMAFTNVTNWHPITIRVTQDGTGNRTLTFPANSLIPIGFGTGTVLNLSTSGGAIDVIYVVYDGSNYLITLAKDFVN